MMDQLPLFPSLGIQKLRFIEDQYGTEGAIPLLCIFQTSSQSLAIA